MAKTLRLGTKLLMQLYPSLCEAGWDGDVMQQIAESANREILREFRGVIRGENRVELEFYELLNRQPANPHWDPSPVLWGRFDEGLTQSGWSEDDVKQLINPYTAIALAQTLEGDGDITHEPYYVQTNECDEPLEALESTLELDSYSNEPVSMKRIVTRNYGTIPWKPKTLELMRTFHVRRVYTIHRYEDFGTSQERYLAFQQMFNRFQPLPIAYFYFFIFYPQLIWYWFFSQSIIFRGTLIDTYPCVGCKYNITRSHLTQLVWIENYLSSHHRTIVPTLTQPLEQLPPVTHTR